MRKFTIYNLRFTMFLMPLLFLLVTIIFMFAAPTTASAAPTATVSGPTGSVPGRNSTFTVSASGTGISQIQVYRTRTTYASWVLMNTCYNTSTCSASWAPSSSDVGDWYIVANVFDANGQCSGNPFVSYPNGAWSSCNTGRFWTGVYYPPSTPTYVSQSCGIPGTTGSASWSASSGADRYEIYAFDLAYGSPNWSAACGTNGRIVCAPTTNTSYSFPTTSGRSYQWFVWARNTYSTLQSDSYASNSFTCAIPNCNTNLDCVLCGAPANTCSTNNGTQTCYYRGYTGGGTCNVVSFNQSCTINKCDSPLGYSCINGTCIPTPPTPTISANPSCTPANTSSMYTISWASTSPAVLNVDISTNNFASWYNKATSGTSTSASSGFNGWIGVSGPLTLQPGTTYYVRTWNGYKISATTTFTTPGICPPPAPTSPIGSCPAPGTPASLSWTAPVGGTALTRYDLYVRNTNLSEPTCGIGTVGGNFCERVYTTSKSFASIPGNNYSWSLYACNNGGCSSSSIGGTFTCTPPNCNTNLDCVLCGAPANTCSTNNGTQTCYYRGYTGGGTCNVVSFNQACTINKCDTPLGYSCINGTCAIPPSASLTSAPTSLTVGTSSSFTATANGSSISNIQIYRSPTSSQSWTLMGSCANSPCTVSWTPSAAEAATSWYITVNAYGSGGQCTGNPWGYSSPWISCGAGSTVTSTVKLAPPTSPSASCPVPGSNANLSWTGSSGAGSYTVYAFNLAYGTPNWSACGSNGMDVCQRVTGTSTSAGNLTPGANYQWYVFACTGNTNNCSAPASYSSTFACLSNNAQYVSQSCPPSNMIPGQTANVSVIMNNNGNTTWPASSIYRLGSQNPQDNPYWGGRIIPGSSIPPGSNYTFASTVTAPSTPGTYNFQWRMLQEGIEWFGGTTPNCSITVAYPPPPTANINSPANGSSNITGQTMTVSATAAGTNLNKVNIYRAPATSDLTQSANWTLVAENDSCAGSSICGVSTSWTPSTDQIGQWVIAVNAFDNYGRNCSGMGSSGGYWTAACNRNGSTSNVTINVVPPPPRASVNGPSSATVGYTATFNASLTGSARSGQIWITKGDGRSTFSCPQGPNSAPYLATSGFYWCPVARQDNTTSLSGTYQFVELGTYTTVVNAYSSTNQSGSSPSNECSGTPSSLGFNSSVWSDCGTSDNFTTTIYRPPTPSGSVNSSCIPEATISWAGSNPAITYVDISENSNFSTFYNKYVAGSTSTSAPGGFNGYTPSGASGPLTLQPNTTYYLRSWNGYDISYPPSSFRTNDCPPRASVSGPNTMVVGDNLTFTASLTGSARSGQIWITKGDGRSTFSCPQGPNSAPYLATSGFYWCPVARQDNTTSLSGTYTFTEPGSYTTVVNAFSSTNQLGSGPSNECTGTPASLGFNSSAWSDCGANDNILTINAAPRASVTGPEIGTKGLASTFTATLTGGARSGQLWITKGDGRSVFPCPTTIYFASTGRFWCGIGNGAGSTITGTYTFREPGTYTTVVNAYANTWQTGTGPSDQCTGTPSSLGINPSAWSDCGTNDNVATVISSGPAASLTGSSRGTVGTPTTFTANLFGSALSGTISITKGDGRSNFYCNGADNNATRASTGYYWCTIGSGAGPTVTGSYTFPKADSYTAVVNAFTNPTATYTGNSSTECTGTPSYLATDQTWTAWSDCGANDYVVTTSFPPAITNCGSGTVPRAEGLVTTPSLTGNFPTSPTGRCVKDSATAFKPFKIPSYDDLKSIYYTQSKATKSQSNSTNLNPISPADDGEIFNYTASDVNVNFSASYNGTAVIFIEGNLNIRKNITASAAKGLVFVVKNNVIIDQSVTQIDAVIISGGTIYTAATGSETSCSRNSVAAGQLNINGSLVSLDNGNIIFCRVPSNNSLPAEIINADPKYLVILRNLYADTVQRWSEIP